MRFALAQGWNIFTIGYMRGASLIEKKGPSAKVWALCDNGGKFHCDQVNGEPQTGIPYTRDGHAVNVWTAAYRVAMRIKGEEVDWDYVLEDM